MMPVEPPAHAGADAANCMGRLLVILGVVLVVVGLAWPVVVKLGLGRLPGDLVLGRGNFRLYMPVTTSILVSLVLTLILWLFRR